MIAYKTIHIKLHAWIESRNESFGITEHDEVYNMY